MANNRPRSMDHAAAGDDMSRGRRRLSSASRHKPGAPSAPRRAIRPVLLLVALVNLAWSLYQLPVSRVVESRLCRDHYADHDPSALRPDGTVPEELCKIDGVQQRLGRIQGIMETLWVVGDFLMTIPLVSLADHYGYRLVLCLNLFPRVFLLCWTFLVGYFDRALPVNAILAAPVFSFLGGDCVFNSIVYGLVSELTDDHVLRATFFGYVNAVSSIFSLQLGPALASAAMSTMLWLPLWVGMVLLIFGIPVITALLPKPRDSHRKIKSPSSNEEADAAAPLIPTSSRQPLRNGLISKATARFHTVRAILTNPTRNFLLLLTIFFLASLASSDTKLLPLYISKRYTWKFSSIGYLLSVKAVFNFFLLSFLIPRFLRWRRRRQQSRRLATSTTTTTTTGSDSEPVLLTVRATDADRENMALAHTSLVFSVLGALAIAVSPSIGVLVPSLLLYAMGIALPMFTYSLLKSPSMGLREESESGHGGGMQLFSMVMLVRTVGTLVGAVVMPALWVTGVGIGGWALGLPFVVSAFCYGLAGLLVRRMRV